MSNVLLLLLGGACVMYAIWYWRNPGHLDARLAFLRRMLPGGRNQRPRHHDPARQLRMARVEAAGWMASGAMLLLSAL